MRTQKVTKNRTGSHFSTSKIIVEVENSVIHKMRNCLILQDFEAGIK